ncbi:MAG: DNA-methyltransferase [Gammaproteobacteria bacterium]
MRKNESLADNRMYRGDCMEVMRRLHEEGVAPDLIYLDPPFNSNRDYNIVFRTGGKDAQQVAFSDMWGGRHAEQLRMEFMQMLQGMQIGEGLKNLVEMWMQVLLSGGGRDHQTLNYLLYMTPRLIWMRKVLSPRGSVYLHCDPTASHYLKVIMDAVFGSENFRNEIIWHYAKIGVARDKWTANTDHILFYGKSSGAFFDFQVQDRPNEIAARFAKLVRDNKLYYGDLKTRNDSVTRSKIGAAEKRLGRRLRDDDVVIDFDDKKNKKRMDNVWHIPSLKGNSAEYRGYHTQKPVALLKNIIRASCPEGGLVFDPFCGCGTTIEAAHLLGRRWIGADISTVAVAEMENRAKDDLQIKKGREYSRIECDPQTRKEYDKLDPYAKQKWLVERVGGVAGRRGADRGVDGTILIHLGGGAPGAPDKWGRLVVSVKNGKQADPAHLRELQGTMREHDAAMGGLILDREPSKEMRRTADGGKTLSYRQGRYSAHFPTVQILTADEVLDGKRFNTPPTLMEAKRKNSQGVL